MSFIISNDAITVFHPTEFKPYTFCRNDISDKIFDEVIALLNIGETIDAIETLTPKKRLENFFARTKDVTIEGGVVKYRGAMVDNYAAQKALDFAAEGLPYEPILGFINRVQDNPSFRAVQELYGFLEAGELPLTPDGCFLAYKKVRIGTPGSGRWGGNGETPTNPDSTTPLVDIYTGNFDNSVGQVVQIPRNQVDEDPNRTCSHGLHVCSHKYLPCFGCGGYDRVVVVKIDPADVVAVPKDYDNAKMRVCRYEVMSLLEGYTENVNVWDGVPFSTEFDEGRHDENCSTCGSSLELDLDGYDGQCADCADANEPEELTYEVTFDRPTQPTFRRLL